MENRKIFALSIAFVILLGSIGSASAKSTEKTMKVCDNFGFVWTINPLNGQITGSVVTTSCGTWNVAGTYDNSGFKMKATNPRPGSGCATWFVYQGTCNKQAKTCSGTWNNDVGGTGSFTMSSCTSGSCTALDLTGPRPDGQ